MNVTVIVALIAAIAAVISPIITTSLNNQKELQIKKIDIFHKTKTEVYQSFCSAYGALADDISVGARQNFLSAAYMAAIALEDEDEQYQFFSLAAVIETGKKDSTTDAVFLKCIRVLSKKLNATKTTKAHKSNKASS